MTDLQARRLDAEILRFMRKPGDFEGLAMRLFEYQYERNPLYRRLCQMEGVKPGYVEGWKRIPAMPAGGFKELELASFPVKKAVKIFRTSGTTRGSHGAHFFDTLKLYEAALVPPFRANLLKDGAFCRFYFLMASPKEVPHSSLSHMMGVVNRRFSRPAGKFYYKNGEALYDLLYRDLLKEKRRAMILATAFSLKGFFDFLGEKNLKLRLPKGSRLMETGGFKGRMKEVSKASLYRDAKRLLGIPKDRCFSEYGMTELSSQFYSRGGGIFTGPPWIRTVVIDPKTGKEARKGKSGVLRHFDLANRGSVMAVQTEDMGRLKGKGFEVIGRASGAEIRGCSLSYEELLKT